MASAAALACGLPAGEGSLEQVTEGIRFFEARLGRDPEDGAAARQLVARHVTRFNLGADLSDLDRAEAMARRALALTPDRGQAWSRLSGILLMGHQFARALEAADSALTAAPNDPDALGAAFDAALAVGRYRDAAGYLDRLPERDLRRRVRAAALFAEAGRPLAAAGEMARVCAALSAGHAPAPAQAWCLTELGGHEEALGPGAARRRYHQALRIEPGYRGAREALADLDAAEGRHRRALRAYRTLAGDAHPDIYLRLAESARLLGREDDALDAERHFLASASAPAREAMFGPELARFRLATGGTDQAVAIARREVSRRPTVASWELLLAAAEATGDTVLADSARVGMAGARAALMRAPGP